MTPAAMSMLRPSLEVSTSPLRVGIFDQSFRTRCPSITHGQQLPPTFNYVDLPASFDGIDVVMATTGAQGALLRNHYASPRRVLWLQENREYMPHPPRSVMESFDLVLTNDASILSVLGPSHSRWLTPIGTWITDTSPTEKTNSCSTVVRRHVAVRLSAYDLRESIAREVSGVDIFGSFVGRPFVRKEEVLQSYRFHVVVEAARYNWYATEKLFDCFATRTIPIYFGPPDLTPLAALGFDVSVISPWQTIGELKEHLAIIAKRGESIYADATVALETNYKRIHELRCTEIVLEPILRDHFNLR